MEQQRRSNMHCSYAALMQGLKYMDSYLQKCKHITRHPNPYHSMPGTAPMPGTGEGQENWGSLPDVREISPGRPTTVPAFQDSDPSKLRASSIDRLPLPCSRGRTRMGSRGMGVTEPLQLPKSPSRTTRPRYSRESVRSHLLDNVHGDGTDNALPLHILNEAFVEGVQPRSDNYASNTEVHPMWTKAPVNSPDNPHLPPIDMGSTDFSASPSPREMKSAHARRILGTTPVQKGYNWNSAGNRLFNQSRCSSRDNMSQSYNLKYNTPFAQSQDISQNTSFDQSEWRSHNSKPFGKNNIKYSQENPNRFNMKSNKNQSVLQVGISRILADRIHVPDVPDFIGDVPLPDPNREARKIEFVVRAQQKAEHRGRRKVTVLK